MKIIYTLFIALFFNIAMFGTTYTSVADGIGKLLQHGRQQESLNQEIK